MKLSRTLFLLLALGLAQATPRIGHHDTYTRLAFDLPAGTSSSVRATTTGSTVTLTAALPSERGTVRSPHLTGYEVTRSGSTSTVRLSLTAGRNLKAFVLPAAAGTPARLVLDVGPAVAASAATSTARVAAVIDSAPKAPVKTATVVQASARPPTRPKLRVVLDAGHGGSDPGMTGFVVEKEVTLSVARKVRERLVARGIDVVMTRDRDAHLHREKSRDLNMRADMAKADSVNVFVSIHVNAASPAAQGIETWVFGQPIDSAKRALAVRENGGGDLGERITREASNVAQNLLGDLLAQSILSNSRKLATQVQKRMINATGAVNRGVGSAPFAVIRNPRTPAILIELGFGTHPVEGRRLADNGYRDRLAGAIADSIAEFLHAR